MCSSSSKKYAIERAGIEKAATAREVEFALTMRTTAARKAGYNVEIASAAMSLDAARERVKLATTWEEKQKASGEVAEATLALDIAKKTTAERRMNFGIDSQIADLRVSTDAKAAISADKEIERAKQRIALARTDVEMEEAKLALSQARASKDQLGIQTSVRRIGFHQENQTAGARIGAARVALGGRPDDTAIAAAQAQVTAARAGVDAVNKRAAAERNSLDAVQGQRAAEDALTESQLALLNLQREIKLARADELRSITGENAALKLAVGGFRDRAQYAGEIVRLEQDIAKAQREGRDALAQQLQIRERLVRSEEKAAKYLHPDGRRKNVGQIQRADHAQERASHRIDRFNQRFELDPITGKRILKGDQKLPNQQFLDQAIPDQMGFGGLATGGLKTGGLMTGHLRAGNSNWHAEATRRKHKHGAAENKAEHGADMLKALQEILRKLPSAPD